MFEYIKKPVASQRPNAKRRKKKKPVNSFSMLIHVNAILDTTSISEDSQESGNYKTLHIIYASASVGLCCPFIVACMFWRLRRYHGE